MDEAGLVVAELDLTAPHFVNHTRQVVYLLHNGAALGAGHQTAPPQDLTELTDLAHHIGGGDGDVEIHPAALDLLDQVIVTCVVSARLAGDTLTLALGEDQDADLLTSAMWQHRRAAHNLVGVARVNPQPHMHFDGAVELGVGGTLYQVCCLLHTILPLRVNLGGGGAILLAVFVCHCYLSPLWSSEPCGSPTLVEFKD